MKFAVLFFVLVSSAFAGIKELNLDAAKKIADKALACGKEKGWKLSVAIVNSEGNLLVFQRGDQSYVGSIEAAMDKARSANAFQRPTKAFADAVKEGRTGLVTVKDVVANEGGLPIQNEGVHLGAIGVSGARSVEDEVCAQKALQ